MTNPITDAVDQASAKRLSDELLRTFRGMAAARGQGVTLAAIEHAVGSFCDEISPRHAAIMGAAILGVDPAEFMAQWKKQASRGGALLS
jgi:hypothetical protein